MTSEWDNPMIYQSTAKTLDHKRGDSIPDNDYIDTMLP